MTASRSERAGAIHLALPWRGMFPETDGGINANDRAILATMYGARFSTPITSTRLLHKPVDYALAGDQQDGPVRKGRMIGRGLRRIFNE